MRRMISLFAVMAVMATMVALSAMPAVASHNTTYGMVTDNYAYGQMTDVGWGYHEFDGSNSAGVLYDVGYAEIYNGEPYAVLY